MSDEKKPMSPISPISPMSPAGGVPPKVTPFATPASEHASTVRLKPVIRKPAFGGIHKPGEVPAVEAPVASKKATGSLNSVTGPMPAQAILHKTGIIAEGVLSPAQVQASKTKTSRISLASAIGVAPATEAPAPLKTIRLRRPTDIPSSPAMHPVAAGIPSAPSRQTSRIPDSVLTPVAEEEEKKAEPAADITQKKTLKIHRPGSIPVHHPTIGIKKQEEPAPDAGAAAPDGLKPVTAEESAPALKPLSPAEISGDDTAKKMAGVPKWVMTTSIIASTAALLVLGVATYFLVVEGCGPYAGPNDTAFVHTESDYRPGR